MKFKKTKNKKKGRTRLLERELLELIVGVSESNIHHPLNTLKSREKQTEKRKAQTDRQRGRQSGSTSGSDFLLRLLELVLLFGRGFG